MWNWLVPWILICWSLGDFWVCIQTQLNLVIKSSNEAWRLIVFAPFLIKFPSEVLGTSCFCTVSYYYYYYYYYYSSSSSLNELVRPNSQKLMIRSLLNFTGRWIPSQEGHSCFGIFKMATNMKIKKIVKNSKMKIFQWKWIFTGSKTCCTNLASK